MFRLEIKKVDGSHYWTQDFDLLAHAESWLAEEQTRPYWDAFTYNITEIIDIGGPSEQDLINQEALAYLASTDWYVIRQQEIGIRVPDDVLLARQAARNRIVR